MNKRRLFFLVSLVFTALATIGTPKNVVRVQAESCSAPAHQSLLGQNWQQTYVLVTTVCNTIAHSGTIVDCGPHCTASGNGWYEVVDDYQIFRIKSTGVELYLLASKSGRHAIALYSNDPIMQRYSQLGGQHSGMGFPREDDLQPGYLYRITNMNASYAIFEHGAIFKFDDSANAYATWGDIFKYYAAHGFYDAFGIPTTDEYSYDCHLAQPCRASNFSKGYFIAWRGDTNLTWSGVLR